MLSNAKHQTEPMDPVWIKKLPVLCAKHCEAVSEHSSETDCKLYAVASAKTHVVEILLS